jgi:hypothetical protein
MKKNLIEPYRYFLKDTIRKQIDFSQTDQNLGVDPPPIEKPCSDKAVKIDLPKIGHWKGIPKVDLAKAIINRQSRRSYLNFFSLARQSFPGRNQPGF